MREIAILVVAGHYQEAYQIYAHVAASERAGMLPTRIFALTANVRPSNLSTDEAVAFDSAYVLFEGGPQPEPTWQRAVDAFDELGTSQLIYLVGVYSFSSMTLKGFGVPVPQAV